MKKILLLLSFAGVFACSNKQVQTTKPQAPINRTVVGITLGDSRKSVVDTLKNQGYNWEDVRGSLSWFRLNEEIEFSGHKFQTLSVYFKNAKVDELELMNRYYLEEQKEEAFKVYNEIKKKLDAKYLTYKDTIHTANLKYYTRYDDHKTNVILCLDFHPKEKVDPLFANDLKSIEDAMAYWYIDLWYSNTLDNITNEKDINSF